MTLKKISEIEQINKLIDAERETEKNLTTELAKSRERMKTLLQMKFQATGHEPEISERSIPDLLEAIFRKYGAQHISKAALLIESEFGKSVATQTISGALVRYVNRGKRFKKAGKNTFDVIDVDGEEKRMLKS